MENDLTLMYGRVVYYSNLLREAKAAGRDPGFVQTTMTKDLFLVVAHCFFNQNKDIGMYQAKTVRTRAGSQKQTIRAGVLDKLSGYGNKKTAFRRRINSKVVNNVIRSVITASGGLSINEVGVPKIACLSTFVRCKVTEENYEQMLDLVIRGFPNKNTAPSKNGSTPTCATPVRNGWSHTEMQPQPESRQGICQTVHYGTRETQSAKEESTQSRDGHLSEKSGSNTKKRLNVRKEWKMSIGSSILQRKRRCSNGKRT